MNSVNKNINLLQAFTELLDKIEEHYNLQVLHAKKSLPNRLNFRFNDQKYSIYIDDLRDFYQKLLSDFDISIEELSFFQFADEYLSKYEYELILFAINKLDDALLTIEEIELREILNEIEKQLSEIEDVYFSFKSAEDYDFDQQHGKEMLQIFSADEELSFMVEMYEDEELSEKIEENKYNTGEPTSTDD